MLLPAPPLPAMLYIQVSATHHHRLLPINGPHRVVKRLGRRAHGWNANRTRTRVRLPPREVKIPKIKHKGFFVTNYLYSTGVGIGLVGELFCLYFPSKVFSPSCRLLPFLESLPSVYLHKLLKCSLVFYCLPQTACRCQQRPCPHGLCVDDDTNTLLH